MEMIKEELKIFIAPYVATPHRVARHMLTLADVKTKETVYDLGCGDGRLVIMAAREFGAKGVGVELRGDLVKQARERISELHLEGRVKIVQADLFNVDIGPADVVTLYLTTSANTKIRPKLESQLKPGVRVVSHDYEIVGWRPVKVDRFCEVPNLGYPTHTLYLYHR